MAQTPVPTPINTVKLMTGDSGLTFSGNTIDNNAPEGWAYVAHSLNRRVISGLKMAIPVDTVSSYDAIRQYSGTVTVIDVVGNRIAGRFVVNAADNSSPDDGGGCLVDVLGRRWVRQADYVTWDMFGAPRVPDDVYDDFATLAATGDRTGAAAKMANQIPADDQAAACFAFAKEMNIAVKQNDGIFLWKNTELNVYTCTDLRGSTVVTTDISGVNEIDGGRYLVGMKLRQSLYACLPFAAANPASA